MWLAQRDRRQLPPEGAAEEGRVTLEGERLAVYAQGERRELPTYGPGGYCWRPRQGEQVLVMKLGQEGEQCCVAGMQNAAPSWLRPGEVLLQSAGGAMLLLRNDGSVQIYGELLINGEKYLPCACAEEKQQEEG